MVFLCGHWLSVRYEVEWIKLTLGHHGWSAEVVMFTFKHLDLTMQTGYTRADGISSMQRKVLMLCIMFVQSSSWIGKERTRLPVPTYNEMCECRKNNKHTLKFTHACLLVTSKTSSCWSKLVSNYPDLLTNQTKHLYLFVSNTPYGSTIYE